MTYKLKISDQAALDYQNIANYYNNFAPQYSKRILRKILSDGKRLTRFTQSGRTIPEQNDFLPTIYREIIVQTFRIIYKIENQSVVILRIIDGRRFLEIKSIT